MGKTSRNTSQPPPTPPQPLPPLFNVPEPLLGKGCEKWCFQIILPLRHLHLLRVTGSGETQKQVFEPRWNVTCDLWEDAGPTDAEAPSDVEEET